MAALDTNVVIRLLVGDDAKQAKVAERLLESQPCIVALSVLMECEWVLRACYHLSATQIESALRSFLNLHNVGTTDPVLAQSVLDAYAAGLDFADALHALQRPDGEPFATFDKPLVRGARKAGVRGVVLLK